jgi:hypothetical protein
MADRHAIMDDDQVHAVIHVAGRYVHIFFNYNNINPSRDEVHIVVDNELESSIAKLKV